MYSSSSQYSSSSSCSHSCSQIRSLNIAISSINGTVDSVKKLPFLDVLIDSSDPKSPHTSIYRKKTFSGLLTNYFSFCSFVYKIGLIRTLEDRAYKINSTWEGLHKDLNKLTYTLHKNSSFTKTVEIVIKNYLTNAKTKNPTSSQPEPSKQYFKLPYIGPFSKIADNKIRYLVKKYC